MKTNDYFIGYRTDPSEQLMVAFSFMSTFEVRLPAGNDNTFSLYLFIHIRDTLDCVTEFNMSSVIVTVDSSGISNLINILQYSTSSLTTDPLVRLIASGNQNTVAQIVILLSQRFNSNNTESLQKFVSCKSFK
jgi:hypothetical protein